MKYDVINEELGFATCALEDLTMGQTESFLKQWEPGATIGSLVLFYDEESDLIVFNKSGKDYKRWMESVEAYLTAKEEKKEILGNELDKCSPDVKRVLDGCVKRRMLKDILFKINKTRMRLNNDYDMVLFSMWKDDGQIDSPRSLYNAFAYGMMCGKRLERAKKANR